MRDDDSVSGLNFVLTSVQASGRPSIATMSLGGGATTSLDNAVASVSLAVTISEGFLHLTLTFTAD